MLYKNSAESELESSVPLDPTSQSFLATAVAATLMAGIAAPTNASPLQPVRPWSVDYGTSQCTAVRAFETPRGTVSLGLIPSANGETYEIRVAVPRSGPSTAIEVPATIALGSGPIATRALFYGARGVPIANYDVRVSAAQLSAVANATAIGFRAQASDNYEFASTQMPDLLATLAHCTADLQRAWNLNVQPASFRRTVDGRVASLLAPSLLASDRDRRSATSLLQYQLLVDEQGKVARCDVVRSSGAPFIDARGCNILTTRARFKPALDAAGRPSRAAFLSAPVNLQLANGYFDSGSTWAVNMGRDILNNDSQKAYAPAPAARISAPSSPPPRAPAPPASK